MRSNHNYGTFFKRHLRRSEAEVVPLAYPVIPNERIQIQPSPFPNRIPGHPPAEFGMVVSVAVVVEPGVRVLELGVEEEAPVQRAGGARGEAGVHEADRAEGIVAEALDNGGRGVDDGRRVEVVLEQVTGLVEGAGHRALAPDHRPAIHGTPDVGGGYRAVNPFLHGTPLAVVIVVDGSVWIDLAGPARERVVLVGDLHRHRAGCGRRGRART